MKLYPIIGEWKKTIGSDNQVYIHWEGKWNNWTNTYLKEMNSKILSLFDYIFFFNPDFYQCDLQQTVGTNPPSVQLSQLPFHGYYRVNNKVYDVTTTRTLEPGTLVVAYGRGEGETDNKNAINRNQINNYTIQPFGWASYYLMQFGDQALICTYDQRAQETYGLNYVFVFDTITKRYYIRQERIIDVLKDLVSQPTSMSFISHSGTLADKDNWYIVNQNQNSSIASIWSNITNNPLMHAFFYIEIPPEENPPESPSDEYLLTRKIDNLYNYEEIIFDNTWQTSSKIAETNIAVYTINRKESSSWPNLSFLWFEAW